MPSYGMPSLSVWTGRAFAFLRGNKTSIPTGMCRDLTGRTAKKSIEKMRRENETSGKKSFRPTAAAMERGTITTPVNESKKESKRLSKSTNKVQTSKSAPTATAQKSTAG